MLVPVFSSAFNRDYKRAVRRGKDPGKIQSVIRLLCTQGPLPASLHDHPLKGKLTGVRDCHVEPDLILLYRVVHDQLQLICLRLGTHADLFGN